MNSIIMKLRSCVGESIAETLVALLISSLALLMLAGAVTASTRVIKQSSDYIDKYYIGNINLAEYSTPVGGLQPAVIIKDIGGKEMGSYDVNYYVNKFGNNAIVAYNRK